MATPIINFAASLASAGAVAARNYQRLEEKILELEKVSGRDIDELISLFASGYDLVRTEYKSLKRFAKLNP